MRHDWTGLECLETGETALDNLGIIVTSSLFSVLPFWVSIIDVVIVTNYHFKEVGSMSCQLR